MLTAALLLAAAPVVAPTATTLEARTAAAVQTAKKILNDEDIDGPDLQGAYDALAPVVTENSAAIARDKRLTYCNMSDAETEMYKATAAKAKQDAVLIGPAYCEALSLQGYALIQLRRLAAGRALYDRLLALAPYHAHYLTAYGLSYIADKNWAAMGLSCARAQLASHLASEDRQVEEEGSALRCQGRAFEGENKLGEAEKLYQKCLALNPNDAFAKNELTYIAGERGN